MGLRSKLLPSPDRAATNLSSDFRDGASSTPEVPVGNSGVGDSRMIGTCEGDPPCRQDLQTGSRPVSPDKRLDTMATSRSKGGEDSLNREAAALNHGSSSLNREPIPLNHGYDYLNRESFSINQGYGSLNRDPFPRDSRKRELYETRRPETMSFPNDIHVPYQDRDRMGRPTQYPRRHHPSNEPRPQLPLFDGRGSWDAFWLTFEMMIVRYGWVVTTHLEQLIILSPGCGPNLRIGIASSD